MDEKIIKIKVDKDTRGVINKLHSLNEPEEEEINIPEPELPPEQDLFRDEQVLPDINVGDEVEQIEQLDNEDGDDKVRISHLIVKRGLPLFTNLVENTHPKFTGFTDIFMRDSTTYSLVNQMVQEEEEFALLREVDSYKASTKLLILGGMTLLSVFNHNNMLEKQQGLKPLNSNFVEPGYKMPDPQQKTDEFAINPDIKPVSNNIDMNLI